MIPFADLTPIHLVTIAEFGLKPKALAKYSLKKFRVSYGKVGEHVRVEQLAVVSRNKAHYVGWDSDGFRCIG